MNLHPVNPRAILLLCLFVPVFINAQAIRKFGDVPPETFASTVYKPDTSASAVFLFDKGHVSYVEARKNSRGFNIVFEKHTRIHLLNKNAFGLASMTFSTYAKNNPQQVIEDFQGATYNLEDGKVVATKLDANNIFKDKNGNFNLEKVVFPNVKAGSVIEYSFRIVFPEIIVIPPWTFQSDFPVLWSEYEVAIPEVCEYAVEKFGRRPYTVDTLSIYGVSLGIDGLARDGRPPTSTKWVGVAIDRVWAMSDVPALPKIEPYTTSLKNYINRIEFQLSGIRMFGTVMPVSSNWDGFVKALLKSENFGTPLSDRNHWMTGELKHITGGEKATPEAARKIYTYVRDHFSCTGKDGIRLTQPLQKTWDEKKGSVADINLLVTALCLHQGLDASPVILSTRSHGVATVKYPLFNDYNYVVARVMCGNQPILLDASKDYIGFGTLPEICYNGSGRIIDSTHNLVILSPDSVTEKQATMVVLANDSTGYFGNLTHTSGTFESMAVRERLKTMQPDNFFEGFQRSLPEDMTITEKGFDSLDNKEELLSSHYKIKYNLTQKSVYFNPLLNSTLIINPFSSPDRHYPVEFSFLENYSYALNMEVPQGYAVEELPKSQRITMSDDKGSFEYMIDQDGQTIQFYCVLRIKRSYFSVEQYAELREFFSLIVKKEKEVITLKKIN